jgi:hypothetical protein
VNERFLKDHILDFEVIAALGIIALAHFYFERGWLLSALLGISAFIVIPLMVLCLFHAMAFFYRRRS